MKLIVFGATGNVGKQLVYQALAQGHAVTAYMRNKEKLADIQHENLQAIVGDVFDYASVLQAVQQQDAVLCALGSGRSGVVRSEGTGNIIKAMKEAHVSRLVCQTTLGCGESWANLNFFWKRIMFGWYLKDVFNDHERQEKYIMESPLKWTIIRPGAFTKGKITGSFKHGFAASDKSVQLKISPADVAFFMLAQMNSDQYLYQTPGLSY